MKATFLEGQNAKIITSGEIISSVSQSNLKENVGLTASVAASALTIELKQSDGSSDATVRNPARIGFRGTTEADGDFNVQEITAALSLVISSGSTLGHASGAEEFIYIYALDNSGTVELAASTSFFADGTLQTTVAEGGAGAADDAAVLYSTTLRSNVPITLLARMKSIQATAGTWATDPSEIQNNWSRRYTLGSIQTFTASGTWTKPDGVSAVKIEVYGAGGGGGGSEGTGTGSGAGTGGGGGGCAVKFIKLGLGVTETVTIGAAGTAGAASGGGDGGAGGTSSFGSHASATGGEGGSGSTTRETTDRTTQIPSNGGTGSSGDINVAGSLGGGAMVFGGTVRSFAGSGGTGGGPMGAGGGRAGSTASAPGSAGNQPGGGGAGGTTSSATDQPGGAGGVGLVIVWEFY